MSLYYVLLNANDSIREKSAISSDFKGNRFLLAVEAEDDESADALIQGSFGALAPKKDFGEVMIAHKVDLKDKDARAWWFGIPEGS